MQVLYKTFQLEEEACDFMTTLSKSQIVAVTDALEGTITVYYRAGESEVELLLLEISEFLHTGKINGQVFDRLSVFDLIQSYLKKVKEGRD